MPSREVRGLDFIGVAVADATHIHTQLLADAIGSDPGLQVVVSTSSAQDLLTGVRQVPVDVAVINFALDDQPGRGPDVLREIRSFRPQIKGVVLLDSCRPHDVLECFSSGAKGIFSKHGKLESLRKCIRCVHEGQIWASSSELEHVLGALANSPLVRATDCKGINLLSQRERQVIQYLAAGMTNREIAKTLSLSPHTVKNYLFRIFDKLGVSNRTELLSLTMNSPQPSVNGNADSTFAAVIEAAESGNPSAQLRLAEHLSQVIAGDGHKQDPVAAYMWYLLAEKTAAPMFAQIEAGKRNLGRSLSLEQIAEADARAADWLKNSKKQPSFAESDNGHGKVMAARP